MCKGTKPHGLPEVLHIFILREVLRVEYSSLNAQEKANFSKGKTSSCNKLQAA